MVKHIILWKLKEELSADEALKVKADIKRELEALVGKVPGLIKMYIRTEGLESSAADIMMDSELVDEEALKAYQKHPEHVKAADTFVRPNVAVRLSMDYEA